MRNNIYRQILLVFILFILYCTCNRDNIIESPQETETIVDLNAAVSQAELITNLRSLVIYQNGSIVRQALFNDCDLYTPNDVRSITKSITSLLIGIAIDKGIIKSIDQNLREFIIPSRESIPQQILDLSLQNLLEMSAGFEWEELQNVYNYNWWIKSQNQIEYLFTIPIKNKPGEIFSYNSAAYHLLSVILTNTSKMSTLEFATKYLFEPLEIGLRNWGKNHDGYYNGSSGLQLSPYDMYKIGQLIINKGLYKGKRIISSQWIEKSTSPTINTNKAHPYSNSYGLGWWIGDCDCGKYIFANGYGGQYIVIVPNINLVVTATNHWNGVKYSLAQYQWIQTMKIIVEQIMPVFNK